MGDKSVIKKVKKYVDELFNINDTINWGNEFIYDLNAKKKALAEKEMTPRINELNDL